ncbi:LacI family transcriptional regulator [Kribbella sp. VKM Ac-2571]|uniref:LacI family DNA-binding transcriptional regulator n=1 Tax=Kribbella sp. VKM Ac-2571 TaxID=2512222 RepID=UPI00105B6723|nr:LacI family DNA-binding transcriptional regulator [Kribbella sp. VKM Ac-2571]TDO64134.1 LacI family transcriptional regulator [Kribbella sp. VKM Ac-2571]
MPSGPTGRPATIYDVAARAKLSIATVSRVLQGTGPVSAKARERVDQAARELNYVPLRAARSLAVQRHEAHGLVLPDLAGPFYGDLLMGYERWAGEHGQSVVITVTHGNPDPRRTVMDLAGRVDGIVVHGNALDLPTVQGLRKAGVPVVLIAHPPVTGCDSVRSESAASAEQLTTRLLDHGRESLLFVGDPASSYDVSERYAGFAKAHELRGLQVPKPVRVPLTEEAGRTVAEKMLQAITRAAHGASAESGASAGIGEESSGSGGRPDGLVCANDELALAVLALFGAHGVGVPGEIVVTGWDDVMAARYVSPGLTTVRQPMAELGRVAAERLHERVTGARTRARNDVLATELVLRDSCGTNPGDAQQ